MDDSNKKQDMIPGVIIEPHHIAVLQFAALLERLREYREFYSTSLVIRLTNPPSGRAVIIYSLEKRPRALSLVASLFTTFPLSFFLIVPGEPSNLRVELFRRRVVL